MNFNEQINNTPEKIDEYQLLKNELLSGKKSVLEVRNILKDKDQETSDRKASIKNLEFLLDNEVKDFILLQDQEIIDRYYSFLSFTEFHVAQIALIENSDIEKAKEYIQNALDNKNRLSKKEYYDNEWVNYLKATLLYLDEKEISSDLLENVGKNKEVLERLNNGIKERGFPNYRIDYAGFAE